MGLWNEDFEEVDMRAESINGLAVASVVFALGMLSFSSASAQQCHGPFQLTLVIQNNTAYKIDVQAEPGSPGSCRTYPPAPYAVNSIFCYTSLNQCRIFQSIQFSYDNGVTWHQSTPELFVSILSERPGEVTVRNPVSEKYCVEASVTPTTWDGYSDVDGVLTFNYSPMCQTK